MGKGRGARPGPDRGASRPESTAPIGGGSTAPASGGRTAPSAPNERAKRAREDLEFFCKTYLPHVFSQPFGVGHGVLEQVLKANAFAVVLAFRGWGKSTLVTFAETLRLLVTGRVEFVVLTGRTAELTRPLVLQLRIEMETNALLQQDFGPFERGALWQQARFALKDGREVLGRPLGGTARGVRSLKNRRPQLWVLDDLQELEDGRRPERIRRVLDFVKGVVVPAMEPPAPERAPSLIRIVGTKMSEDCAMARLESEEGIATFRLDAEDGDFRTASDPARFPLETLREYRRLLGADAYAREYLNTAIRQDGMVRRAWLRTYRDEELRGLELACAVYWDPAIRPGGDYKAIVSLALHRASGRGYVLDAFLERNASPDEQARELCRQWRGCLELGRGTAFAGYEANGMQGLMEYPLERHRAESGLAALPLQRRVNTGNKYLRVATLVPLFERGALLFREDSPVQQSLMDQWVFWPRRGTDGPDAMHGAWMLLHELTGDNETLLTPAQRDLPWHF